MSKNISKAKIIKSKKKSERKKKRICKTRPLQKARAKNDKIFMRLYTLLLLTMIKSNFNFGQEKGPWKIYFGKKF